MTLVAAAVCPHPPLLVPALAAGAAAELDEVRAACRAAVDALATSRAPVHVVGVDTGERADGFAPWGVDVRVEVAAPAPLSHLVAAWLLGQSSVRASGWHLVAPDASADDCVALGRRLAAEDVALLVMGDGSARHSERAPGWLDARAGDYDAHVARALAEADAGALSGVDPDLSAELMAAGRPCWQVLAGAADEQAFHVEGAMFAAPYGVGYHVVTWRRAGNATSGPNPVR